MNQLASLLLIAITVANFNAQVNACQLVAKKGYDIYDSNGNQCNLNTDGCLKCAAGYTGAATAYCNTGATNYTLAGCHWGRKYVCKDPAQFQVSKSVTWGGQQYTCQSLVDHLLEQNQGGSLYEEYSNNKNGGIGGNWGTQPQSTTFEHPYSCSDKNEGIVREVNILGKYGCCGTSLTACQVNMKKICLKENDWKNGSVNFDYCVHGDRWQRGFSTEEQCHASVGSCANVPRKGCYNLNKTMLLCDSNDGTCSSESLCKEKKKIWMRYSIF